MPMLVLAEKQSEMARQLREQHDNLLGPSRLVEGNRMASWLIHYGLQATVSTLWGCDSQYY